MPGDVNRIRTDGDGQRQFKFRRQQKPEHIRQKTKEKMVKLPGAMASSLPCLTQVCNDREQGRYSA
jgi:hypothetical protein